MDINLEQFDKVGEKSKILEFSQPALDLMGSIIKNGIIEGAFGTAEIINVRCDPTILISKGQIHDLYEETCRAVITKSNKHRKLSKILEGENKN